MFFQCNGEENIQILFGRGVCLITEELNRLWCLLTLLNIFQNISAYRWAERHLFAKLCLVLRAHSHTIHHRLGGVPWGACGEVGWTACLCWSLVHFCLCLCTRMTSRLKRGCVIEKAACVLMCVCECRRGYEDSMTSVFSSKRPSSSSDCLCTEHGRGFILNGTVKHWRKLLFAPRPSVSRTCMGLGGPSQLLAFLPQCNITSDVQTF